jgi:hypothetical protein
MDKTFYVAKEFSSAPSGLTARDGVHNATALRKIILGLLQQYNHVTIDLDGVGPLKASFYREAFAALVYREHLKSDDLQQQLSFACASDGSVAEQARLEIEDAHEHLVNG